MDDESSIPGLSERDLQILRIFQPRLCDKALAALKDKARFVHYTSADTAIKMIKGAVVWMRKSSCMNDFMEIEHGMECLRPAYKDSRERFQRIFDGMYPGFSEKLENLFNGWLTDFRTDTYLACLFEHIAEEDQIGRLSMWRAYGGATGVAIVVNSRPFLLPSDALKAYTRPVSYLDKQAFAKEFGVILDEVERNIDLIKELGEDSVSGLVFDMFRAALLCTKHPGFLEEREWRVIYCPTYEKSDRIMTEIESIGGVPQPVCKVALKDVPDEGLIGIEVPSLVERVIIGPTQYPLVVREALISILEESGVPNASDRVVVSDIPLRQ